MCRRVRAERGFTLIELLMVVAILGVLAAMAIARLDRAKVASNEASAISSLRVIDSAEATYAASCGGDGYAQSLEGLATPPSPTAASFISADLTTTGVLKSGYLFTLQADPGSTRVLPAARTCNNVVDSVTAYFAYADPQVYRTTGRRNFATDRRAVIFFRNDGMSIAPGMAGANPID